MKCLPAYRFWHCSGKNGFIVSTGRKEGIVFIFIIIWRLDTVIPEGVKFFWRIRNIPHDLRETCCQLFQEATPPHATLNEPGTESSWEYLFIDTDNFLREQYTDNPRKAQELIRRISKNAHVCHVSQTPVMAGLIRHIMELMRRVEEYYLDEVKCLLLALLLEIAKMNANETENRTGLEKYQPMISVALDYISDNYAQEIRIQDLAKLCHISETHFRRVFHACMQMTPADPVTTP